MRHPHGGCPLGTGRDHALKPPPLVDEGRGDILPHEMRTRIKFYTGGIVSSISDAGPWHAEARDPAKLRAGLGDDLLIAFAQLFIWADRLAAIAHLMRLDSLHVPKGSVAAKRNIATLVAYSIGVLYEAARAIRRLRRIGVAGLIPNSVNWKQLDALHKRWWDTFPLKDLRNQIAFHAEESKIRDGLDRFVRKRRRLLLLQGDDSKKMCSQHTLGSELILAGLRYTRRDLRRVCEQIAADHGALGDLAEEVFIEVLNARGLMRPL
jgi:hypothetical protein